MLLEDIRDAASGVLSIIAGRTLDDYRSNLQFKWAVERGFEIIGEAMTRLKKLDPTIAMKITDYRAIIGFRNVLIHAYSIVDDDKTWQTATAELPLLLREVEALLKEKSP